MRVGWMLCLASAARCNEAERASKCKEQGMCNRLCGWLTPLHVCASAISVFANQAEHPEQLVDNINKQGP